MQKDRQLQWPWKAGQDCKWCRVGVPNAQWFWAKTQASRTSPGSGWGSEGISLPDALTDDLLWCKSSREWAVLVRKPGTSLRLYTDCFPSAHRGLRQQPARVERRDCDSYLCQNIHSILTETKMNTMNLLKQQKGYICMTNAIFVTFKNHTHNYLLPILSKLT